MGNDPLGNLLTDAESIAKASRDRRKLHIEKSVNASTRGLVDKKVELEEHDGWQVLRRSKKTNLVRLKKDKPGTEQLEDYVWVTLAGMGFDELSDGRQFCIDVGGKGNPRQLDVFAKDSESVIIVECTTAAKPSQKNMTDLIQKIVSIQHGVGNAVRKHYGHGSKLKIKWCIATRNIYWRDCDLQKAKDARIIVLADTEINYYSKLTAHLKGAAKYQFLSHLFADQEITGLELSVPATRGGAGKRIFYNFLMRPSELLKVAYVSHKASRDEDDLKSYQRNLQPKRLKDIGAFVDDNGQFPTNIVINIKSKKGLRFEEREKVGDASFGVLHLPPRYASCWIIDGQHRLYGYAHSERAKNKGDKTILPILAYDNLPVTEEAKLFVDINCKQVKVTKGLLLELYSNLRWDSPIFDERIDAVSTRVVAALDMKPNSPFHDRLLFSSNNKSHFRCLTLTSFTDGLKGQKFFGRESHHGPFFESRTNSLEASMKKAIELLTIYFNCFRNGASENWGLGDSKGGFLCTNNGVRALLVVLKEILNHISSINNVDLALLDAKDIEDEVIKLASPIVSFFSSASPQEIDDFRSRQALQGVNKNAVMMMDLIHDEDSVFNPLPLTEYLATVDKDGTDEAHRLVDEMQERLFSYTLEKLKGKYGEVDKAWWFRGVPEKVRLACMEAYEKDKGQRDPEQYICLINYRDIAVNSWDIFQTLFTLGENGNRKDGTKWMVELNTIRNITHHREKWPASKDQVKRIREIHQKLMKCLEELEPSS
jgi:DNA sulfur modification protein DndB